MSMGGTVINLGTIRARRAAVVAEAAVAAQKRDPLSNPRVILIVQLLLSALIVDQAMREFSIISDRRPS